MSVKIPEVKIYKTFSKENFKQAFKPRNIVSSMASDGFLPVIALEAFVEAGRTYQAYKRGGFDEARERITEEFSGAVFWLGGVTGLNWLFEKIGQKLLRLPNKKVKIGKDSVRNPLNNYLAQETRMGKPISKNTMAAFKFTKVIASVLIANAFIGFVLPKINQAITRSYHKNKNNDQNTQPKDVGLFNKPSMENFGNGKKQDVTFGMNLLSAANLLTAANNFETNRNWKLLSVDAGTCSGRVYSARNNDERVEIAFRDLSSIYFYMFNMQNMNRWLNRLEHKNDSRLDPVSEKFATEYMKNYVDTKETGKVNVEEFSKEMFGENKEIPESIKTKLSGTDKETKTIKLEDFKSELKKLVPADEYARYEQIADKMSELQPKVTEIKEIADTAGNITKTVNVHSILTERQVQDVLNGGYLNDPEFLKAFYRTKFKNKFLNSYEYVPQSEIDSLKTDLVNYVKSIIAKAQKTDSKEITKEILERASKNNFKMNAINWGAGFAISALFLSTLIPKMQYLITKLRTGNDNFPGTQEFRNETK